MRIGLVYYPTAILEAQIIGTAIDIATDNSQAILQLEAIAIVIAILHYIMAMTLFAKITQAVLVTKGILIGEQT